MKVKVPGKSATRTPEQLASINQTLQQQKNRQLAMSGPTNQSQYGNIVRANPVVDDWYSRNTNMPLGTDKKTQAYRQWSQGWQQNENGGWENPLGKFENYQWKPEQTDYSQYNPTGTTLANSNQNTIANAQYAGPPSPETGNYGGYIGGGKNVGNTGWQYEMNQAINQQNSQLAAQYPKEYEAFRNNINAGGMRFDEYLRQQGIANPPDLYTQYTSQNMGINTDGGQGGAGGAGGGGAGLGQSANGVPYVGSFTGAGGKKTFMDGNGFFYDQDTGQAFGQIDKNTGIVWGTAGKFQNKPLGYIRDGVMYDSNGNPQNFDSGGQFDLGSLSGGGGQETGTGGITGTGGGGAGGTGGGNTLHMDDYRTTLNKVLFSNPALAQAIANTGLMSNPLYLKELARPQMNALMHDLGARGLAAPGSYGQQRSEEIMGNIWANNLNAQTQNALGIDQGIQGNMQANWLPQKTALDTVMAMYYGI